MALNFNIYNCGYQICQIKYKGQLPAADLFFFFFPLPRILKLLTARRLRLRCQRTDWPAATTSLRTSLNKRKGRNVETRVNNGVN